VPILTLPHDVTLCTLVFCLHLIFQLSALHGDRDELPSVMSPAENIPVDTSYSQVRDTVLCCQLQ